MVPLWICGLNKQLTEKSKNQIKMVFF
jgi:hypothetical protein